MILIALGAALLFATIWPAILAAAARRKGSTSRGGMALGMAVPNLETAAPFCGNGHPQT